MKRGTRDGFEPRWPVLCGVVALAAAGAASGCTADADGGAVEEEAPVGQARQASQSPLTCVTIQRAGAADTSVYDSGIAQGASTNLGFGISGTIHVGMQVGGSVGTGDRQELMQFDLSSIPSGAAVSSATVSLYLYPGSTGTTINVHQVTAPWSETLVSWDSFNGAYVAAPTTSFNPGAANPFNPLANPAVAPNNPTFDLSSLAQAWISGTAANDGILLQETDAAGQYSIVLSSEWSTVAERPSIEVCYVFAICDGVPAGAPAPACVPAATQQVQQITAQASTAASQGQGATATALYEQAIGLASCYQDALGVADNAAAHGYGTPASDAFAQALSLTGGQVSLALSVADNAAAEGYGTPATNAFAQATCEAVTVGDSLTVADNAAAEGYGTPATNAFAQAQSQVAGQLGLLLQVADNAAAEGYGTPASAAFAQALADAATVSDSLTVADNAAARGYGTPASAAFAQAQGQAAGQLGVLLQVADNAAAEGYGTPATNAFDAALATCTLASEALTVAANASAEGYGAVAQAATALAATLP